MKKEQQKEVKKPIVLMEHKTGEWLFPEHDLDVSDCYFRYGYSEGNKN